MKAVLFDVEGTLIDCAQQTIAAWQQTLHSFGYEISKAELQQQSGRDSAEMLERLLPDTSKAQRDELAKKEGELYQETYLPSVCPFAGVPELFRKTKSAGFKIGLATTCKPEQLGMYRDLLAVDDMLDAIACGEDAAHGKPHPDLFEVCLRKLGCMPHDALAVGDTPYDARAARLAGVTPIGLETGSFSRAELMKAGCAAVFSDPADLLNSDPWFQASG
jgi:phosphoglycolate phosphatase-like HAD superfamily hydrolase